MLKRFVELMGFLIIAAGLIFARHALPDWHSPYLWSGLVAAILGIFVVSVSKVRPIYPDSSPTDILIPPTEIPDPMNGNSGDSCGVDLEHTGNDSSHNW